MEGLKEVLVSENLIGGEGFLQWGVEGTIERTETVHLLDDPQADLTFQPRDLLIRKRIISFWLDIFFKLFLVFGDFRLYTLVTLDICQILPKTN